MNQNLRLSNLHTNFQKICRTCLIEKDNLQAIFRIVDLLKECTSIQIDMEDDLPKLICLECTNKLNNAFEFRKQCEVSQKILLQLKEFEETPVKFESNGANQSNQIENVEINEIDIKSESSYNINEDNSNACDENNKFKHNNVFSVKKIKPLSSVHEFIETTTNETKNINLESEITNSVKNCLPCDFNDQPLSKRIKKENSDSDEDNVSDIRNQNCDESLFLRKNKCNKKSSKQKDKRKLKKKDDDTIKNGLPCLECKKCFELEEDLEIHMLKHQKFDDCICPICSKFFKNENNLKQHFNTHMIDKPYKCNVCNKSYAKSCDRNRHLRVHTGGKLKKTQDNSDASNDNKKFKINDVLSVVEIKPLNSVDEVIGTTTNENKNILDISKKQNINLEIVNNSVKNCLPYDFNDPPLSNSLKIENSDSVHEVTDYDVRNYSSEESLFVRKNKCNKKSSKQKDKKKLKVKNDDETVQNGLPCPQCKKCFELQVDLEIHMLKHQKFDEFICPICSKIFKNENNLKQHFNTHMTDKPYKCSMCDKRYAKSCDRNRHVRIHTGEKPFICTSCGKRFTDSSRLSAHMKYHLGVNFVCTVCSKSFTFQSELQSHMRVHSGEKPFLCTECGESFSHAKGLKVHKLKHTGERPYSCTECDKRFLLNEHLKIHMRSHTGEKPYVCKICEMGFARSDYLIIHNRSHTGERPYSCTICEKTFKSSKNLSQHKRTHNKER